MFIWEKTSRLQPGQPGASVSWDHFFSSPFAGMNISRDIVLSLVQFDFSYSSSIITLISGTLILGLLASKSNPESYKSHLWFVSWHVIYHKSIPSKMFFSFIFATGRYFHFWVYIVFNMHQFFLACPIFVSMNYLLNSLFPLISVLITLFIECFFAIFKNITQAIYKQKRLCKVGRHVCMGKKLPTKTRSRFRIPVRWENLFSSSQFLIFQ